MKNFVVGYGSLINFESQNITAKTNVSIPIRLKNYTRSWSVTYDEMNFCALGVYRKPEAFINAVLFDVEDIDAFDKREHGYNRIELKQDELELWLPDQQHQPLPRGRYWMYLPFDNKKGEASERHLIWQSYVDVILLGCLSIGDDFALEFIETTSGWDLRFLHNDRLTSHYIRALKHYDSQAVDKVLENIKHK